MISFVRIGGLVLFILSFFVACATPKKNINVIKYGEETSFEKISPDAVKVFNEQIPEGFTFKNNVLEIEKSYIGKYKVIGRIEVSLVRGFSFNLLLHQMDFYTGEMDGLQKYCWYNPIGWFPFPGFNYLNPLTWPCFAMDNYVDESPESIKYRQDLMLVQIRKQTAELGANMIINYSVGGIGLFSGNIQVANRSSWSASGYAVKRL
jgi:hypothetical protein